LKLAVNLNNKRYIFWNITPCQPTLRKNVSLPSSGSKRIPSKKPALKQVLSIQNVG
jgi:hypothetical protein